MRSSGAGQQGIALRCAPNRERALSHAEPDRVSSGLIRSIVHLREPQFTDSNLAWNVVRQADTSRDFGALASSVEDWEKGIEFRWELLIEKR